MMKIRLLKPMTFLTIEEECTELKAGHTVSVSEATAKSYIEQGFAELVNKANGGNTERKGVL